MENPANMESRKSIVSSFDKFSQKFYKALVENENSNLICSPLSVSMVLSMAAFGAYGETEKELLTGLNLLATDEGTKHGIQSLIDALNNIKSSELRLANKIFTRIGYEVNPEFLNITEMYFRSTTESLNFGNAVEASGTINTWCALQTNNRISHIIDSDCINSDTRLILVNAVYFKGFWRNAFEKYNTQSKFFHIDEQTKKLVPMMRRTGRYNYGQVPDLNAHYIELPYKNNSFTDTISMFIILPDAINGLKEVETNLEKIDFKKLKIWYQFDEINLHLPKFRILSEFNLTGTLQTMGIKDMFTSGADFRRISPSEPLKVDYMIQKAFIEVNEEGTEAAAVTAMGMSFGCAGPTRPPIEVVVDRPFFCAIVATNTGTQLFNARVIDPITV